MKEIRNRNCLIATLRKGVVYSVCFNYSRRLILQQYRYSINYITKLGFIREGGG